MNTYSQNYRYQLLEHTHIYYTEISHNLYEVKKNKFDTTVQAFVLGDAVARSLNTRRKVVIERMDGKLLSTFKLMEEVKGFEL